VAVELNAVNEKISTRDAEMRASAGANEDMCRLMEIPGVGPTIASVVVAAFGTGNSFAEDRDLAAWLPGRLHPVEGQI